MFPGAIGSPFTNPYFSTPIGVIGTLDRRSEFDDELKLIRATDNPYAARRDTYLAHRQAEIDALHQHRRRRTPKPGDASRADPPS